MSSSMLVKRLKHFGHIFGSIIIIIIFTISDLLQNNTLGNYFPKSRIFMNQILFSLKTFNDKLM